MLFNKAGRWACFFLVGLVLASVARAQPYAYGVAGVGFSGLGLTPSASPIDWGAISLAYDTVIPGANARGLGLERGHNINLTMGVLPGLEINARLATNNLQCNLYGLNGGCPAGSYRDLSGNFKLGHSVQVGQNTWLSAAVGGTDFGGAATFFRSYYAAASVRQPWGALNLGKASGVSATAPLNGIFGSAAVQLMEPLQVFYERLGQRQWVSARFERPLWQDERVKVSVSAHRALQQDGFTPRQWLSFGLQFHFDTPASAAQKEAARLGASVSAAAPVLWPWVPEMRVLPEAIEKGVAVDVAVAAVEPAASIEPVASFEQAGVAQSLSKALADAGFESISVGEDHLGPIVQLENYAYNWNQLDALGVAMGVVGAKAAGWTVLRLQILRRGIPVYLATATPDCMIRWLAQFVCDGQSELNLAAGQHARVNTDAVQWWVRNERSSTGRTKFYVYPVIDSRVGSEYGTLDSSWGLVFNWQTPLWKGATSDIAYVKALGHSADYAPGGIFSDFRIDSRLYRVMLHQTADLPWGLSARFAAGRLAQLLDGHHSELRWESPGGGHRLTLERSQFKHRHIPFLKEFSMATYRHYLEPISSTLELKTGQWWHGDSGQMAILRHWFGDTSVALYVRRSRFAEGAPALFSPYGSVPVMSAGFEIAFPMTPRREVQAQWLQPRGDDRFSYGIQSVIGAATNTNYITPYFGNFSPVPLSLDHAVYNFDRGSQAYLAAHLQRIRQGWQYFLKQKDMQPEVFKEDQGADPQPLPNR